MGSAPQRQQLLMCAVCSLTSILNSHLTDMIYCRFPSSESHTASTPMPWMLCIRGSSRKASPCLVSWPRQLELPCLSIPCCMQVCRTSSRPWLRLIRSCTAYCYCSPGSACSHDSCIPAWYCMVLHGTAWYCMVLHGLAATG